MKKIFIICIIFYLTHFKSSSQIDYEIPGYVFNLPSYSYCTGNQVWGQEDIPASYSVSDLLRLRLKPSLILGENTRIDAQYEINGMLSDKNLFILTEIKENKRQLAKLAWNLHTGEHTVVNHYIDRLYFKHLFESLEITVGRQRISWGTGRVWQPTDLFNPLNPANFSKIEKDGADAVTAKYFFGDFTDLELVANPTMNSYYNNYGGRFRTNYKEYDMSLMGGFFDGRGVIGGDFAGNLYDGGLRGEFLYSMAGGDYTKDYWKFIVGYDYQFNPDIYALIEYLHNGEGKTCKLCYDLDRLASGDMLNVGRDYIAVQGNLKLSNMSLLSLVNIMNLNDVSGLAKLSYISSISWNWNFNLSARVSYGSDKTEYRLYPISIYLTTEYIF